jgi:hypothetical protein
MSHHSATQPHPAAGYGPTRVALFAAIYVPTAMIALILYRAVSVGLILSFVIAFAAWTSILAAGFLIVRRSHRTH